MKIIAFPFAGGNSQSYSKLFQKNKLFVTLTYAGRGTRFREELISDADELIEDMFIQTLKEIDTCDEYIIYGHSMGALIAYLVLQKIEENGVRKPKKLIVSGSRPPIFPRKENISHLPDNEFWDKVLKFGGMPDDFSSHPELVKFFTPILKSDFHCIEHFKYRKKALSLSTPIDVFYGSNENITDEEIEYWNNETSAEVTIKKLNGNHFFIFENYLFQEEINSYIRKYNSVC